MDFSNMRSPELQEKLKSAKTPEELLEIAKESGYELSDKELEGLSIAAGSWDCWTVCHQQCSPYNMCPHDIYD